MLVKTVSRGISLLDNCLFRLLMYKSLVRVAAKELTSLLLDEDRLRSERSDRKLWKSRVSGLEDGMQGMGHEPPRSRRQRPPRTEEEDVEYKLAIEASKHEAEEERRRREQGTKIEGEDDDLAKAIRLSKEEEELRRRELEQSNAASLFGDATPTTQPQPTGFNQGYQQQGAVDWFGNPLDAQKPMSTGMLNNVYSQPTGFQPQPTGFANGYGFQQQPTGFDQSQFQQPQQQQQNTYLQAQPQPLQQQQTAFTNNPYGNDIFGVQQPQQPQQTQQPQQQQQNFLQPGSHNPWAGNNQQPMESLKPMPTGSNNPFATGFNIQRPQTANGPPSLSTLAEQKTATQFNTSQTSTNPILGYQAPPQPQMPQMPQQPYKAQDPHRAQLNSLLATGEGQDTFGNVGDLRIPAQHTAPGVFVNSAGQGLGRMQPNPTANNPFLNHHLTGLPNNQPNNNPFGAAGAPQGQPQGGSLIDL